MKRRINMLLIALGTLAALGCKNALVPQGPTASVASNSSIYGFTMKDIDGNDVPLERYKGKVLLIVNVASKCGMTPQYEGLQALYKKYHAKGFEVLGFPSNDFRSQEPGTNAEIKDFCTRTYNVTFPMFSKITVLGDGTDPLYRWLIAKASRQDPIEWNFAKFLVDRRGQVVGRFAPKTNPASPELATAIENAISG